jgi:hypothetical protein
MSGELEAQEILVKDFDCSQSSRLLDEGERTIESNRVMTQIAKRDQIAPGTTSEVENSMGPRAAQFVEQRLDVLRHIVVFGRMPEMFRAGIVMFEGLASDFIARRLLRLRHWNRIPEGEHER